MPSYNSHNDSDLIYRISCGDQIAFQALFDQLMNDVFRLSYSILLDHQMAEDATQDVFVKLWNHAAKWKPDASIKTWLLRVARNHCVDVLRKKHNDLKKHQGFYKDHILTGRGTKTDRTDDKIDQKEYRKTIKNVLFSLPERQREAITLVYYNEVRNLEAASIMGLQPAAFDSLLARARRSLREELGERDDILKGYAIGTR